MKEGKAQEGFPPPENEAPYVKKEEGANTLVTYAQGADIKTLDELLAAADVNLEEWVVDRWVVNKWPVGAKTKDVSLQWEGGVMDGHVEEHGLTVAALWQVKAWLVRKDPIKLFPTVRPISCEKIERVRLPGTRKGLTRALVIADPHFGFIRERRHKLKPLHSRETLDLALQVAVAADVDRVDWLGDLLDLAEWSARFIRTPELCETTQPAVVEGHWWMKQMRLLRPLAEMKAHEGNHEKRIRDALAENLRAAIGLRPADELELPPVLSPARLLGLHNLDVEWVDGYPADADWLNDGVGLSHGERVNSGPGDTAKTVVSGSDSVQIFGHCHRQESASRTMFLRGEIRVIQAWGCGCACHLDGRVPAKGTKIQWQNGFLLVDYDPEGEWCDVNPLLVRDGELIYDRQLFTARNRDDEIGEALAQI